MGEHAVLPALVQLDQPPQVAHLRGRARGARRSVVDQASAIAPAAAAPASFYTHGTCARPPPPPWRTAGAPCTPGARLVALAAKAVGEEPREVLENVHQALGLLRGTGRSGGQGRRRRDKRVGRSRRDGRDVPAAGSALAPPRGRGRAAPPHPQRGDRELGALAPRARRALAAAVVLAAVLRAAVAVAAVAAPPRAALAALAGRAAARSRRAAPRRPGERGERGESAFFKRASRNARRAAALPRRAARTSGRPQSPPSSPPPPLPPTSVGLGARWPRKMISASGALDETVTGRA
jgi:hypothetical protein